jgi:hypothetical protein
MNRDDLRAKAKAARAAIAAHAALNEDDRAEGAAYARMEAAVEALREAVTPDVVLELIGPPFDPAALRAKALAATPGPWWPGPYYKGDVQTGTRSGAIAECRPFNSPQAIANAAYIAAIDPTTLLALLSDRDALVAERLEWMQAFGAISRAVAAGDGESDNTPWPDVVARIERLGRAWVDALRQSVGEASRANTAEAERAALAARVAGLGAIARDARGLLAVACNSFASTQVQVSALRLMERIDHAALAPAPPAPEGPCSCANGSICIRCPIHNPSGTWED